MGQFSTSVIEQITRVNNISRFEMTSQSVGRVGENHDGEMRCNIVLKGPCPKVETRSNQMT